MPSVYQFSEVEILAFFLVLLRMSAFVVSWPVFGVENVPASVKILLAFILSLLIFPIIGWQQMPITTSLVSMTIIWLAIKEIFIGLSIGYLARFFFFAITIMGEIISVSMGLSSAQLFSPSLGGRSSASSQFLLVLATLFFLVIQGHHLLLAGIVDSFRIVPMSSSGIDLSSFVKIGVFAQEVMVMGLKMCSPVMIAILFLNFTMAVIGRAVPQINVLITSMPVNVMVGLMILIVSLPLIMNQMNDLLELTTTRLFHFIKSY